MKTLSKLFWALGLFCSFSAHADGTAPINDLPEGSKLVLTLPSTVMSVGESFVGIGGFQASGGSFISCYLEVLEDDNHDRLIQGTLSIDDLSATFAGSGWIDFDGTLSLNGDARSDLNLDCYSAGSTTIGQMQEVAKDYNGSLTIPAPVNF